MARIFVVNYTFSTTSRTQVVLIRQSFFVAYQLSEHDV